MRKLSIKEVQKKQLELMKSLHEYLNDKNITYYMIAGSALGAVRHGGFIPWDEDIDIGMFRDDYEKFLSLCDDFDENYEIINFKNANNCDYVLTRIYIPNTYIDDRVLRYTKLNKQLYFDIFPLDNVPNSSKERIQHERKILFYKRLLFMVDVRVYNDKKIDFVAKKIISMFLSPFRNKILGILDRLMKKYSDCKTECVCSMASQYSFAKQTMPKAMYGTPTLMKFEDAEFYIPEHSEQYLTHLYGEDYMEIPQENKRRKEPDVYIIDEEVI